MDRPPDRRRTARQTARPPCTARIPQCEVTLAVAEVCPGLQNIGVVRGFAENCLATCPELCAPMDGIVGRYFQTSSIESVKPLICANASSFDCLFNHTEVCGIMQETAGTFGIQIPASGPQLRSEWSRLAGEDVFTFHACLESDSRSHQRCSMCACGARVRAMSWKGPHEKYDARVDVPSQEGALWAVMCR